MYKPVPINIIHQTGLIILLIKSNVAIKCNYIAADDDNMIQ